MERSNQSPPQPLVDMVSKAQQVCLLHIMSTTVWCTCVPFSLGQGRTEKELRSLLQAEGVGCVFESTVSLPPRPHYVVHILISTTIAAATQWISKGWLLLVSLFTVLPTIVLPSLSPVESQSCVYCNTMVGVSTRPRPFVQGGGASQVT